MWWHWTTFSPCFKNILRALWEQNRHLEKTFESSLWRSSPPPSPPFLADLRIPKVTMTCDWLRARLKHGQPPCPTSHVNLNWKSTLKGQKLGPSTKHVKAAAFMHCGATSVQCDRKALITFHVHTHYKLLSPLYLKGLSVVSSSPLENRHRCLQWLTWPNNHKVGKLSSTLFSDWCIFYWQFTCF